MTTTIALLCALYVVGLWLCARADKRDRDRAAASQACKGTTCPKCGLWLPAPADLGAHFEAEHSMSDEERFVRATTEARQAQMCRSSADRWDHDHDPTDDRSL